MRITVLLLSRMEAVMRPGAQPLLHCANSILFEASLPLAPVDSCLRCLFSSRSHLHIGNKEFELTHKQILHVGVRDSDV